MIGLDLSLRRPAAVRCPDPWSGQWEAVTVSVPSIPAVKKDASDMPRLNALYRWALVLAGHHVGERVFREAPAFDAHRGHAKGEGLGVVRLGLFLGGIDETVQVNASQARKLLLGYNPTSRQLAKKVVMSAWWALGFPWSDDEDLCDAMTVLNWGLSLTQQFFFAAHLPRVA